LRTKHVEKTRVGLWGQSVILKAVWDVTNGIRARLSYKIYSVCACPGSIPNG